MRLCSFCLELWFSGNKKNLSSGNKFPSYFELNRQLTARKRQEDLLFLSEGYTDNLQQKRKDLHTAWKRCFDKKLTAKTPVFKKKSDGNDSIRFVNFNKYCESGSRRVKMPSGLGWLKFRQSRNIEGTVKNATLSQKNGYWFVSFQVEYETEEPQHDSISIVGLDAGIAKRATLSDGTIFAPVSSFKASQDKLAKRQRALSKKIKFSSNWRKQKQKIQRLHTYIANTHRDYLHKVTTTISKNHAMIVIEDLKVSNMSKSAAGTVNQPGRNVRAKSGLNRAILDLGWHELRRQLEYKQAWLGGQVLAINPAYTSQKCACCGQISKDNRKTQARFICIACGYTENADINGARNILAAGHAVLACEVNGASMPSATGTGRLSNQSATL